MKQWTFKNLETGHLSEPIMDCNKYGYEDSDSSEVDIVTLLYISDQRQIVSADD